MSGEFVVQGKWGIPFNNLDSLSTSDVHTLEGIPFTGLMELEMGQVAAQLWWGADRERIFLRFPDPVQGGSHVVRGFWLGFDYDRDLITDKVLVSPTVLTRRRVRELLSQ
jgi:hypothetical protein